jgi:exonuclease VII small subunit
MPEEPAPSAESFEASLNELEKVVKELEAGDLALDRSSCSRRAWP